MCVRFRLCVFLTCVGYRRAASKRLILNRTIDKHTKVVHKRASFCGRGDALQQWVVAFL